MQGQAPGAFAYSGGGYLMAQLVIAELTGERFEAWMATNVLHPAGMIESSFDPPRADAAVAVSWDTDGSEAPLYRFVAAGAAGLFTTTEDLAHFVQAHFDAPPTGNISKATQRAMRVPEAQVFGASIWGLGGMLHVPVGDDFVFGHGGANEPTINTEVRIDPTWRAAKSRRRRRTVSGVTKLLPL